MTSSPDNPRQTITDPLVAHQNPAMRALNAVATTALAPVERSLARAAASDEPSVCFILGPPRSGTTLLYELMTEEFGCAYFSNFAKRLYRTPVAATWLAQRAIRRRRGSYESDYGTIPGALAPAEAGRIWRHWMPDAAPYFQDRPGLSDDEIRARIAAMARIARAPMLVKYLSLQSEIPRLLRLFPRAVFLRVDRDLAENARSIFRGRQKMPAMHATGWWSSHPLGWQDYAKADLLTQSVAHVLLAHREIVRDLAAEGAGDRVLRIGYGDLCSRPNAELDRVRDFLTANGMTLRPRKTDLPAFEPSRKSRLGDADEARLEHLVTELPDRIGLS